MPINSVTITATSEEQIKTYFIKTYDNNIVLVKTTKSKINSLIDLIATLGVELEDWGEMSNFDDIYEF